LLEAVTPIGGSPVEEHASQSVDTQILINTDAGVDVGQLVQEPEPEPHVGEEEEEEPSLPETTIRLVSPKIEKEHDTLMPSFVVEEHGKSDSIDSMASVTASQRIDATV